MPQEELSDLSAIRERLRALESRLTEHSRVSSERHDRTDSDLKELAKTVTRLSETVATLTVSINTKLNNTTSSNQNIPSVTAFTASGISGGGVALVGYYVLRTLGL